MNAAAAFLAADKPSWTERRTYGDCKLVVADVNGNCMIGISIKFDETEIVVPARVFLAATFPATPDEWADSAE